ncbi:hypothetical protein AAIR98_001455 [Elusimicrobium simillimum]|uniref:hypothetical protein n=1 Tax=Elusimicrobium simillimum TaxID=3143438 RepID=UPI003C702842
MQRVADVFNQVAEQKKDMLQAAKDIEFRNSKKEFLVDTFGLSSNRADRRKLAKLKRKHFKR